MISFLDIININGINYVEIDNNAALNVKEKSYYINIFGDIFSKISNKFIRPTYNGEYYVVNLKLNDGRSNVFYLHRLIMITFNYIPNYNSLQVNHIDANKINCSITNMEWTTLQGNNLHAKLNGLLCEGEDCPWSVLTEKDVIEICEMLQNNSYSTISEIARKYNCSITTIGDIARGITWKSVSSKFNIDYNIRDRFTEEQVHTICSIFATNKDKNFQYLYYLIIFHLGLPDESRIRKRIYKLYNKDTRSYYNITREYEF